VSPTASNSDVRAAGNRLHRLYDLAVWPPRVVWLTALWWLGVLAGGVILGLAPATVAIHRVATGWLDDRAAEDAGWTGFWRTWRAWLWRSQPWFWGTVLTGAPFAFWLAVADPRSPWSLPAVLLGAWWSMTVWFLPAMLVMANDPRRDGVRVVLHLAWRHWPSTVLTALALALASAAAAWWVPAALPVALPGLPALAATALALRTVRQEHERAQPKDDVAA